jgi:integrase/recombinase XerD
VYKTLVEFLYFSACRREEALGLQVKHVLSDNEVLFVDTKNHEDRAVYIYPSCHKKLMAYCKDQPDDACVFRNMRGTKIHGVEFLKDLKKRARKAGITKRVWSHLIRHTTASHLAQADVPVRVVQKILGHKKLDSTIYYEQFNKDKQIDAIHSLPLIQHYLPVHDRIARAKTLVEKLGLSKDTRLEYALRETTRYGKTGLILEVFER